jgi:hypothetical protein
VSSFPPHANQRGVLGTPWAGPRHLAQGVPPAAPQPAVCGPGQRVVTAMNPDRAALWPTLPEEAHQSVNVMLIEALWWIGEPLSARTMVDVLDGEVSMWEAGRHLRCLEALGVGRAISERRFKSHGRRVSSRCALPAEGVGFARG